jgi:superfamily I DNA/RNA helicase
MGGAAVGREVAAPKNVCSTREVKLPKFGRTSYSAPPLMDRLSPAQKKVVEHDSGPVLVLAGAGSGKTRVVTARIARLISRGVPASAILAMTFTNKAAQEMKDRVAARVGAKVATDLTVSTFHSFGMGVIRAEAKAFGLKNGKFSIFDQGDSAGAVREILRTTSVGRRFDLGAVMARISHAKNCLWEDSEWREREGDDYDEIAKMVFPRYRAALRSFHAFDFDDLIAEPVRLWRRRPDVLATWQERYRYVMVDEYQDTNHAQLEMVRLLCATHRNLVVVGDDDQSIYAWRGADVSNILDFETHFPGAKVVKLEHNYRSTSAVLSVANAVLSGTGARRHEKVLRPTRGAGEVVENITAPDPDTEAAFVAEEIRDIHGRGGTYREMAVLFRSNIQSEPLESALRERQIPYRLVGGTQFYDRKEVKDLICYLRVVVNPRDEISLRRIINYPARQIGDAATERLDAAAVARGSSLFSAVEKAAQVDGLAQGAVHGCETLASAIRDARSALKSGAPAADVARQIAGRVALREDIFEGSGSNKLAARRWGNVEAFFAVLARHDQTHGAASASSLSDLLRFLTVQAQEEEGPAHNVVTLTTMHGAKGLEFDHVFIVGLEEGLLPHARTIDPRATDVGGAASNDIDEERRLLYVSITRAKERLYLCRCKQRMVRGKMAPRAPSRFLGAIAGDLLHQHDVEAPKPMAHRAAAARCEALLAALK